MTSKFWKKRADLLALLLLVLLVWYPWRFLLKLVLRRESFMYLNPYMLNTSLSQPFHLWTDYYAGAVYIGWLFIHWFGTTMWSYFQVEILVMLLIAFLLYICIKSITKSIFISFSTALLFSINYVGNFEMYADYGYSFFLERIITVPFLLTSFFLLHRALEAQKRTYFIFSLVFFVFGIGLGHFALLFTLPYCLYPFFWSLFNRTSWAHAAWGLMKGIAFGAVAFLFVILQNSANPGIKPQWDFFGFLLHPQWYHYGEKILQQLINSSQYPFVVNAVGSVRVMDTHTATLLTPYVVIAYALSFLIIFCRLPVMRPLLLTVTLSVIGILYLNVYWDRMLIYDPGPNRYLYFPSLLLAIFWSLALWALIGFSSRRRLAVSISCLAVYYVINVWGIEGFAHYELSQEKPVKSFYGYFMRRIPELKKNTVIIASYPEVESYAATFFTTYVGKGNVLIYSDADSPSVLEAATVSAQHVLRATYNAPCNCVREEIIK